MKKLIGLCLGLTLLSSTALAQVTTVDGVGTDKDSAVRDAMRNAVEQVIGTFIDSRTLVDKSVVALDEIYAKSQGYVRQIQILREGRDATGYRLTAQIDVDTNPNSQLMDRLGMIIALNDPRIAVVVGYHDNYGQNDQKEKYPMVCEAAMNNKLISLGFQHVVDSSNIRDEKGSVYYENKVTDYMVLGLLDINTNDINLPSYSSYTQEGMFDNSAETGLVMSMAELDVKVIKTDTQEVIGEFRVESDAIKNSQNSVENKAIVDIGKKAAEKLRGIFSRKAADVNSGLKIIARTESYDNIVRLDKALKGIPGIRNVEIKNYTGGKATIEIDTSMKPQSIYRLIKDQGKLNVFLEQSTANTIEISIS